LPFKPQRKTSIFLHNWFQIGAQTSSCDKHNGSGNPPLPLLETKEYMMKDRTRTTLFVLALTGFLTTGSALAGNHDGDRGWHKGPHGAERMLAYLSNELNLSDEQSAEMLAILQQAEESRQVLHEKTMALMGPEICAQKAETEEAMLAILDANQAESFLQLQTEREERAQDRTGKRKGPIGPDCSDYE
jgi:Spy/CpxP family protein refolding chaperone